MGEKMAGSISWPGTPPPLFCVIRGPLTGFKRTRDWHDEDRDLRCGSQGISNYGREGAGFLRRLARDRDGAPLVLDRHTRRLFPFLETIFADAAWQIEVVKRSAQAKGFEVIPRRWVVERTIAWINRCRRLAEDYENLNRTAVAFSFGVAERAARQGRNPRTLRLIRPAEFHMTTGVVVSMNDEATWEAANRRHPLKVPTICW